MSSLLPIAVTQALSVLAEGLARKDLAHRSIAITDGYQKRRNSKHALIKAEDALAYALARMPATYAATRRAMVELLAAEPRFKPTSLLDIGCGPGTASFAARSVFKDLQSYILMDRNGPFLGLAQNLALVALPMNNVTILDTDIALNALPYPQADLVVASYVLAELQQRQRISLLKALWSAASQGLLLVEPGTPDGFERLKSARDFLLSAGGFIAAPCTHNFTCPMEGPQWCRFLERVQRSRDHRFLKSADRPFEDEPFSYLAVTRSPSASRAMARVVARPTTNKFEVLLPVCAGEGLSSLYAAKRDGKTFKEFKALEWGDVVENPIQRLEAKDEVSP
jgi:ribosomal protein RSM22 (predicted rRNA methylase)